MKINLKVVCSKGTYNLEGTTWEMGYRFLIGKLLKVSGSVLSTALPICIVKPLRDKTVLARHKATLECTVSQSRGRVRWFRGDTEIFAGHKYEICNLDCYRTLVIHHVEPADEGLYTCDALDDCSTARLLVEGKGEHVSTMRNKRERRHTAHKGDKSCGGTIRHGMVCQEWPEGGTKKMECCVYSTAGGERLVRVLCKTDAAVLCPCS